jgi:hypothetical protein
MTARPPTRSCPPSDLATVLAASWCALPSWWHARRHELTSRSRRPRSGIRRYPRRRQSLRTRRVSSPNCNARSRRRALGSTRLITAFRSTPSPQINLGFASSSTPATPRCSEISPACRVLGTPTGLRWRPPSHPASTSDRHALGLLAALESVRRLAHTLGRHDGRNREQSRLLRGAIRKLWPLRQRVMIVVACGLSFLGARAATSVVPGTRASPTGARARNRHLLASVRHRGGLLPEDRERLDRLMRRVRRRPTMATTSRQEQVLSEGCQSLSHL